MIRFAIFFLLSAGAFAQSETLRDIREVPADLEIPPISKNTKPAAGKRVFVTDEKSGVPFVLYLPTDWSPDKATKFPLVIELPGNNYRGKHGDVCTGRPEGCQLGYGVTGGKGLIWVALPFLDGDGKNIATTWWGSKPDLKPDTTIALIKRTVAALCSDFNGNAERVFLAGFSRGSLACNYLGLHDDEIASLWRGMICYSHYDGMITRWPYPNADQKSAAKRLSRLGKISQFICHEGSSDRVSSTEKYLRKTAKTDVGQLVFRATGFRNHNDGWVLRPSPARDALRTWFAEQAR